MSKRKLAQRVILLSREVIKWAVLREGENKILESYWMYNSEDLDSWKERIKERSDYDFGSGDYRLVSVSRCEMVCQHCGEEIEDVENLKSVQSSWGLGSTGYHESCYQEHRERREKHRDLSAEAKITLKRIRLMPDHVELCFGGECYSREDLEWEILNQTEAGEQVVELQMAALRELTNPESREKPGPEGDA